MLLPPKAKIIVKKFRCKWVLTLRISCVPLRDVILFVLEGDKGEGEKDEGEGSGKPRQKVKKKRSFKKSFQGIMNRRSKSDKDEDEKK